MAAACAGGEPRRRRWRRDPRRPAQPRGVSSARRPVEKQPVVGRLPADGGVVPSYNASRNVCGQRRILLVRIPKCRCGAVELPVLPVEPSRCPAATVAPLAAATGMPVKQEAGISQIGNVRDWHPVAPDVFVASAIADVSVALQSAVTDLASGKAVPGEHVRVGLENKDAVRLAMSPETPEKVGQAIETFARQIAAGEIVVATDYAGAEFTPS